jgi:hypothetical protein
LYNILRKGCTTTSHQTQTKAVGKKMRHAYRTVVVTCVYLSVNRKGTTLVTGV